MGTQGTGKGVSGDIVLDAGALIAFERGDPRVKGMLESALALSARVFVPTTALAQVWRDGGRSASLTRLIDAGEVDPLDEPRAKEVGVRLGRRDRSDIADAHVVCCAYEHGASVATSDPDDIQALSPPDERIGLIVV